MGVHLTRLITPPPPPHTHTLLRLYARRPQIADGRFVFNPATCTKIMKLELTLCLETVSVPETPFSSVPAGLLGSIIELFVGQITVCR